MKAFIVKLQELLKMNRDKGGVEPNFNQSKKKLTIPIYQREYKWEDEEIGSLLNDVKSQGKFIGNIILDEKEENYEIVDGQQRITTCFLILMCLYNCYHNSPLEQSTILNLMQLNGQFVLHNATIGDFIQCQDGKMLLNILPNQDIYSQSEDFNRAFSLITRYFTEFSSSQEIRDFKAHLLDCELLVLINYDEQHSKPVEQLFLDINDKAKLLDPEDIFKGHCFENFDKSFHRQLRDKWVELKKNAAAFKEFGIKDTSEFLYVYLLSNSEKEIFDNLTQKLKVSGKHFLEGKTMDETDDLINKMNSYGSHVVYFYNNLKRDDYYFSDICADSVSRRNTNDHKELKKMCKTLLTETNNYYSRIPLMNFVHYMLEQSDLVNELTHHQLRRIISDLYVYMMLFSINGSKKSKKDIDNTVKKALTEDSAIKNVIAAAKKLRKDKIKEFEISSTLSKEKMNFLYSIVDNYEVETLWITHIYSSETGTTLEHFVFPDNKGRKIAWENGDDSFEFALDAEKSYYKKRTVNYILLPKELNESFEHDDIVSKIEKIRGWYITRDEKIPNHICIFIERIEAMESYQKLQQLKIEPSNREEIKQSYSDFVDKYFEAEQNILDDITLSFKNSFTNNQAILSLPAT